MPPKPLPFLTLYHQHGGGWNLRGGNTDIILKLCMENIFCESPGSVIFIVAINNMMD